MGRPRKQFITIESISPTGTGNVFARYDFHPPLRAEVARDLTVLLADKVNILEPTHYDPAKKGRVSAISVTTQWHEGAESIDEAGLKVAQTIGTFLANNGAAHTVIIEEEYRRDIGF